MYYMATVSLCVSVCALLSCSLPLKVKGSDCLYATSYRETRTAVVYSWKQHTDNSSKWRSAISSQMNGLQSARTSVIFTSQCSPAFTHFVMFLVVSFTSRLNVWMDYKQSSPLNNFYH